MPKKPVIKKVRRNSRKIDPRDLVYDAFRKTGKVDLVKLAREKNVTRDQLEQAVRFLVGKRIIRPNVVVSIPKVKNSPAGKN